MLTQERAEKILKYMMEDSDRANALLDLSPSDAADRINSDGYDFTADELEEFGEEAKALSENVRVDENGELDADALDKVSGGIVMTTALFAACIAGGVAMFTAGVTFGYKVARERGW